MELEYDYKTVDWKKVKEIWDSTPYYFGLRIKHQENSLIFQSCVGKNKKIYLLCYVNNQSCYAWGEVGHEFRKYFNIKIYPISSLKKYMTKEDLRMLKKIGTKAFYEKKGMQSEFATPVFNNITQIKKMVTALE